MIEADDERELIQAYKSKAIKKSLVGDDQDFDIFKKPAEEIRKMGGISKNYVRKMDRKFSKGVNGWNGQNKTGFQNEGGKVRSKQINIDELYGYTYFECITPPYNMDYLGKLYEVSPAHHAAVDAKVRSVFGLGFDWIESRKTKLARKKVRSKGGLEKLERLLDDARANMEEWLESTNDKDSFDKIMEKVGTDYEALGNAYIEIGRDSQGRVSYIGHVPAKYMRVRRQRDGFIQMFANRVVYFRNFGEKTPNPVGDDPNPNEIIHLSKYSPNDNYYGVPDIISAKNALAGNEFASRYNLDYFENKAIPRHVIITKGAALSPTAMTTLVEFFETGLRGQHHRSVYVPLGDVDAEIEFKSIEPGKQDSSFGDFRVANNEEIFMAHRIPASRAGVFSTNVSLAASRDADKVFKEAYSRPEQAIFEKIMKKLFKEITDIVEFKLNELSLIDEDVQSQIDERNIRNGVVVPDEVRSRKGLSARPDGNGNEPTVLTAQQQADQKATALQSRARDSARSANSPDRAAGSAKGRQSKGDGRSVK